MDGMTLLVAARTVGLTVTADADTLRIRGPRRAEPVVRKLLAHKAELLTALVSGTVGNGLDGGDVQERKGSDAIGQVAVTRAMGDHESAFDKNSVLGVGHDISLPAGRDHAERLKRLLTQEPLKHFNGHTPIVPSSGAYDQHRRFLVGMDADPTPFAASDETPSGTLCPADLPEPWRELYEELAAIREFDGGQLREHAEVGALKEILERMREGA